jgi:hypothetical protein
MNFIKIVRVTSLGGVSKKYLDKGFGRGFSSVIMGSKSIENPPLQ